MRSSIKRAILSLAAGTALLLALAGIPASPGGQSAVPLSRPGQEDLTFWVNHNGLGQLDVEGEVGFGDMARILMRRRANAAAIRALRDRFTFRVRDMAALQTDDLFRAEIGGEGLKWRHTPERFVVGEGRIFNLPLIVENTGGGTAAVEARFNGGSASSSFSAEIGPKDAGGYFLKVVASRPGVEKGRLVLRADNREISADLTLDVRPMARLRVRLIDDKGGPAAARVYLTASDGLAYAPPGAISRMTAMSAEYYFYAQDTFEIELPGGSTLIEATRGPEYELVSAHADLEPGTVTDVRLRLKRWVNMASHRWFSSDAHIHANYTAPHHQVITPEDIRLQTLAEDLNNANLMVANSSGGFLHDLRYFEGKPNSLSRPDFILYWNEEMRNSGMYGHMSFFNLKSLVNPIYTGFRDTPHWEDYPPNYAQAEAAQRQGGAVTYVHPGYAPVLDRASARELPVDLALGQVDAIDVISNNPEEVAMELWYRLLNCGFRLAISAGTDSFTNVADHYTPGGGRVYVHVNGGMRYADWIQNYKKGRSFASNGPVVFFTVNGREPGDELHFREALSRKVRVKATVRTQVPLDKVEVIVNGKPVITRSAAGADRVTIDEDISLDRSCWIAVRALGPWHRLILNDTAAFAHTSPVYVYFGEQKVASGDDLRFYMDWIQRLIERVNQRGRFASDERKQEVIELFQRALKIYQDRAAAAAG